jgi:UDPglucose 6-dehydrogenase
VARIAVIGGGYVGLTTAACLASINHSVTVGDVDVHRVAQLQSGVVPILEAGLTDLVRVQVAAGRLRFVVGAAAAVQADSAEFVFLCVPTPQDENGSADMSHVLTAMGEIAPVMSAGAVVVAKSTVPVGSSRRIAELLGRADVQVVSNPEFLREGTAVHDWLHPDRIVIGAHDQVAARRVADLYKTVLAPVLITDPASAEMIKYASNAFLATKVSFVNAIAMLCESVGADVREVTLGMGYDRRIGFEFLKPGPGYGGSCFPKDTSALVRTAEDHGIDFALLRGVIAMNIEQLDRTAARIMAAAAATPGAPIAVWGLTFKANTDDLRDSPAVAICRRLLAAGFGVRAFDPSIDDLGVPRSVLLPSEVALFDDPYDVCTNAGVLAVLTEWDEFRWVDLAKVAELLTGSIVIDGRNLLDPSAVRRAGLTYEGIGRV